MVKDHNIKSSSRSKIASRPSKFDINIQYKTCTNSINRSISSNNHTSHSNSEKEHDNNKRAVTKETSNLREKNLSVKTSDDSTPCPDSFAKSRFHKKDTHSRCCVGLHSYTHENDLSVAEEKQSWTLGYDSSCSSHVQPDFALVNVQDVLGQHTANSAQYRCNEESALTKNLVTECFIYECVDSVKCCSHDCGQIIKFNNLEERIDDCKQLSRFSSPKQEEYDSFTSIGHIPTTSETGIEKCEDAVYDSKCVKGISSEDFTIRATSVGGKSNPHEDINSRVLAQDSSVTIFRKSPVKNVNYLYKDVSLRNKVNSTVGTSERKSGRNIHTYSRQNKHIESLQRLSESNYGGRKYTNNFKLNTPFAGKNDSCHVDLLKPKTKNDLARSGGNSLADCEAKIRAGKSARSFKRQCGFGNHLLVGDLQTNISKSSVPANDIFIRHTRASLLRQYQQFSDLYIAADSDKLYTRHSSVSVAAGRRDSLSCARSSLSEKKSPTRLKRNSLHDDKLADSLQNACFKIIMADQATIYRPKSLARPQTDRKKASSKIGIDPGSSGESLPNVRKDTTEAGSQKLMRDKPCTENTKVTSRDAVKRCSTSKVSLSPGFLRQTQSQLLKMKTAPVSVSEQVTLHRKHNDGASKETVSSKLCEKGSRRSRTAPVPESSLEEKMTTSNKTAETTPVVSPILRKVSRKENICSDSPASIRNLRSRKKLNIRGVLSSPEVLSPLTSPTQSENDMTSPAHSDKDFIPPDKDVTVNDHLDIKLTSHTSEELSNRLPSKVAHSKSSSPLSDMSAVSPSLQGRVKSISPSPSSMKEIQKSRELNKSPKPELGTISSGTNSNCSKTLPPEDINPLIITTTPSPQHTSPNSYSATSSSTLCGVSAAASISSSSSHAHRAAQNRSPSLLPVIKRQNTNRTNSQTVRSQSNKTETSPGIIYHGSKVTTDQQKNLGPKHLKTTVSQDQDSIKNILAYQGDRIKSTKMSEPRVVHLNEPVYEGLNPVLVSDPKLKTNPIDKADHVLSGEGTIPTHGRFKSTNEYDSLCMPVENRVVIKSGYGCQESIDYSEIGSNIDGDLFDRDHTHIEVISNAISQNDDPEKITQDADAPDMTMIETCIIGMMKGQGELVSKNWDSQKALKSQKKIKENENLHVKEQSPYLMRRHLGKSAGGDVTKSDLNSEHLCSQTKVLMPKVKCQTELQTHSKIGQSTSSTRSETIKDSKLAVPRTIKEQPVQHKLIPGKQSESKLPRKEESLTADKRISDPKKLSLEGMSSRLSTVTRNDTTKRLQSSLGHPRPKISSASNVLKIRSATSTRESSVESRFDDDAASETSDVSSIASSSVSSLDHTRPGARSGKVLSKAFNRDNKCNVGTKHKQLTINKNNIATSKTVLTNSSSSSLASMPIQKINTSKGVKKDSSHETHDRKLVNVSGKGAKILSANRHTLSMEIHGVRDTTQIKIRKHEKEEVIERGEEGICDTVDREKLITNNTENNNESPDIISNENRKICQISPDNTEVIKNIHETAKSKEIIIIREDVSAKNEFKIIDSAIANYKRQMDRRDRGSNKQNVDIKSEQRIRLMAGHAGINESLSSDRSDIEESGADFKREDNSTRVTTQDVSRSDMAYKENSQRVQTTPRAELVDETREPSAPTLSCVASLPKPGVQKTAASDTPLPFLKTADVSKMKWGLQGNKHTDLFQVTPSEGRNAHGVNNINPGMCEKEKQKKSSQRNEASEENNEEAKGGKEIDNESKLVVRLPRFSSGYARSAFNTSRHSVGSRHYVLNDENEILDCDMKVTGKNVHGISSNMTDVTAVNESFDGISDNRYVTTGNKSIHEISDSENVTVVNESFRGISSNMNGVTAANENVHIISDNQCVTTTTENVHMISDNQCMTVANDSFHGIIYGNESVAVASECFHGISSEKVTVELESSDTVSKNTNEYDLIGVSKDDQKIKKPQSGESNSDQLYNCPDTQTAEMQLTSAGNVYENLIISSQTQETLPVPNLPPALDSRSTLAEPCRCEPREDKLKASNTEGGNMTNCVPTNHDCEKISYAGLQKKCPPEEIKCLNLDEKLILQGTSRAQFNNTASRFSELNQNRDEAITSAADVVDGEGELREFIQSNCCSPFTETKDGSGTTVESDESLASLAQGDEVRYLKDDSFESVDYPSAVGNDDTDSDSADACFSAGTEASDGLQCSSYKTVHLTKSLSESSDGKLGDTVSYGTPPPSTSEVREGGKEERAEDLEEGVSGEYRMNNVNHQVLSDVSIDTSLYKSALESSIRSRAGCDSSRRVAEGCDNLEDYDDGNVDVIEDGEDVNVDDDINENDDAVSTASSESSFQSATSDILMAAVSSSARELVLFEGCCTSKAGEGMAKLIASDSDNLEMACWEECHNITGENIVMHQARISIESSSDQPSDQSPRLFTSTPKMSLPHRHCIRTSQIVSPNVSTKCSTPQTIPVCPGDDMMDIQTTHTTCSSSSTSAETLTYSLTQTSRSNVKAGVSVSTNSVKTTASSNKYASSLTTSSSVSSLSLSLTATAAERESRQERIIKPKVASQLPVRSVSVEPTRSTKIPITQRCASPSALRGSWIARVNVSVPQQQQQQRHLEMHQRKRRISASPQQDQPSPQKDQLSPLKDQLSPLKDQLSPLKDQLSPLNDQLSPLNDQLSPLKDQLSPLKNHLSPLKDQLTPLKHQLSLQNDEPTQSSLQTEYVIENSKNNQTSKNTNPTVRTQNSHTDLNSHNTTLAEAFSCKGYQLFETEEPVQNISSKIKNETENKYPAGYGQDILTSKINKKQNAWDKCTKLEKANNKIGNRSKYGLTDNRKVLNSGSPTGKIVKECGKKCSEESPVVKHNTDSESVPYQSEHVQSSPKEDFKNSDNDKPEADVFQDYSDIHECKSKEFSLHPEKIPSEAQDIRASLLESGYSSDIKSPDMRSPVQEIENVHIDSDRIISDEFEMNSEKSNRSDMHGASSNFTGSSRVINEVEYNSRMKIPHISKNGSSRETSKPGIYASYTNGVRERLEPLYSETGCCGVYADLMAQKERLLYQTTREEGDEDEITAIRRGGYSEYMQNMLSPSCVDNLETSDKPRADVNILMSTRDQRNESFTCFCLDTATCRNEHVCQLAPMEVKNAQQDYVLCNRHTQRYHDTHSDLVQEVTSSQQTEKASRKHEEGQTRPRRNSSKSVGEITTLDSVTDILDISETSVDVRHEPSRYRGEVITQVRDTNKTPGHPDDSCKSGKCECCFIHTRDLHTCSYPRVLTQHGFMTPHMDLGQLGELQECRITDSFSKIHEYRTPGSQLSAHSQNICSPLASCSTQCATPLKHEANASIFITNQVREITPSGDYFSNDNNGNIEDGCSYKQGASDSSRVYPDGVTLEEESIIPKQQNVTDDDNTCIYSVASGDKDMVRDTSTISDFSEEVEENSASFVGTYSHQLDAQGKDNDNSSGDDMTSDNMDHVYKRRLEVRRNFLLSPSSETATSSSLASSMSHVKQRLNDSPGTSVEGNINKIAIRSCNLSKASLTERGSYCNSDLKFDSSLLSSPNVYDHKSELSGASTCMHSTDSLYKDEYVVPNVTSEKHLCGTISRDCTDMTAGNKMTPERELDTDTRFEMKKVEVSDNRCAGFSANLRAVNAEQREITRSDVIFIEKMTTPDLKNAQELNLYKHAPPDDLKNICSSENNSECQTPRKLCLSSHSEGPPKEKSPLILEIVCELLSKVSYGENRGYPRNKPPPLSQSDPNRLGMSKARVLTPEEKARVSGVRAINKWKSMVKKSRVVTIRESLKVKLAGVDESRSNLPPPVSPTPPRKYKWARGESGIWKKVYLDDSDKDEMHADEQMEHGNTSLYDQIISSSAPISENAPNNIVPQPDSGNAQGAATGERCSLETRVTVETEHCLDSSDDICDDISFKTQTQISQECSRNVCDENKYNKHKNDKMANMESPDKPFTSTGPFKHGGTGVNDTFEERGREGENSSNLFNAKPPADTRFTSPANLRKDEANIRASDSNTQAIEVVAFSEKCALVTESRHIDPRNRQIDSDVGNATDDQMTNREIEDVELSPSAFASAAENRNIISQISEDTNCHICSEFEPISVRNDPLNDSCFGSTNVNSDTFHVENVTNININSEKHVIPEKYMEHICHRNILQDGCLLPTVQDSDAFCNSDSTEKPMSAHVYKTSDSFFCLERTGTNHVTSSNTSVELPSQSCTTADDKFLTNDEDSWKNPVLSVRSDLLCGSVQESSTSSQRKDTSLEAYIISTKEVLELQSEGSDVESPKTVIPRKSSDIDDLCKSTDFVCGVSSSRNAAVAEVIAKQSVDEQQMILAEEECPSAITSGLKEHVHVKERNPPLQTKSLASLEYINKNSVQSGISLNEQCIRQDETALLQPNSSDGVKCDLAVSQEQNISSTSQSVVITEFVQAENDSFEDTNCELLENTTHDIRPREKGSDALGGQKIKKHTWPTVAESLRRFQKSIAGNPHRGLLQREREQYLFKSVTKDHPTTVKVKGINCDLREKQETSQDMSSCRKAHIATTESSAAICKIESCASKTQTDLEKCSQDAFVQSNIIVVPNSDVPRNVSGYCQTTSSRLTKAPSLSFSSSKVKTADVIDCVINSGKSDECSRPRALQPADLDSSAVIASESESTAKRVNKQDWSPPSVKESILSPSPIITLASGAKTVHSSTHKSDTRSKQCSSNRYLSSVAEKVQYLGNSPVSLISETDSAPLLKKNVSEIVPVFTNAAPGLRHHQPEHLPLLSSLHDQGHHAQHGSLSVTSRVTTLTSEDKDISCDSSSAPTVFTRDTSPEQTDMVSSQAGVRRHMPSAKLISVSVWDTHDGDKALRHSRRLWTPEEIPTLAGISEIEEAQASHDSKNIDLDSTRLQTRDDCKERVRASRSPVRPHSKQRKAPRRSLSLPTGGLSYGDVKILYKDGHFVMVDTSTKKAVRAACETTGMLEDVSEENERADLSTNVHLGSSVSSEKDGSDNCDDVESNVRAEILSLLERGITDPQRIQTETSLNFDNWDTGVGSRRSKQGAPIFLSLPRRKGHQRQRPVSIDEARLLKYYSASQQSLVSQAEMERRIEEDQEMNGAPRGVSALTRNASFTEAMGSTTMLSGTSGREDSHRDSENAELCDSGFDDSNQKHTSEDSRTSKSRSKGPGFFQRMLQKRKGSGGEKSLSVSSFSLKQQQKNDLSSSSVSLTSISSSNQQQMSSSKRDSRDSSIGRKMSFRSIFKRKNSMDDSVGKTSTSEDSNSLPSESLVTGDEIGAVSPPAHPHKSLHWNVGDADVFHEDVDGAYEVDTLSHSHFRSRSPRTPLSNSSSQSSLYCSLSQDDCDGTPLGFQVDSLNHRSRSSSGKSRNHGRTSPGGRLSGDSLPEYDMSSPELRNSNCTLTSTSVSLVTDDMTEDMDQTLLASPTLSGRLSPPVYQKLTSSPQSGRRRKSKDGEAFQKTSAGYKDGSLTTSSRSVEMVSRNSNDSGIQNDGNVNSSAESIQATVKLRKSKSPSPTTERPKSDTTVRWADLLEQVMEPGAVRYRKDATRLRKQTRPMSDIDTKITDQESDEDVEAEDEEDNDEFEEDCEGGFHTLESRRALLINANSMGNISTTTATSACGSISNASNITTASSTSDMRLLMQSRESLLSLVELRRPAKEGVRDVASVRLAKMRRLSTPQPITARTEKPKSKPTKTTRSSSMLTHAHSMPDNLDKLTRQNYFSLIGSDAQSITSQQSAGDSSDDSEYSMDYHTEGSQSTRSSHVMLAALDQMIGTENLIYAEALWDHVTMDPDELGFRAGDLIRVTDTTDKHWWFGIIDDNDGWFPATFVRLRVNQDVMEEELAYYLAEEEALMVAENAGNLAKSAIYVGKIQARSNVVNEIISAEREYVKHLRDVVEGYVRQARKRPEMFPREKVNIIFSNIEEIFNFATELLTDLEKSVNHVQPHLSELGQCFLHKVKEFEMYSDYCNNHSAACEELRELYRNKRYRHFFEACRLLQEMIEIPLEGFLLTPVQKICKYHLQLAELLKFTPTDHPDFCHVQGALDAMKKIAMLVNERKRKMESVEKLAAWQLLVDDWEGPDILEGSSELIYSGELNKINHAGWSQERYFFLFDHQLIYCKKDLLKKSSFCFKGRISMDSCQVVNLPDGRDPQYNVSVRNAWKLHDTNSDKWYLLVAKTTAVKQRWLKAFQDERRRVKDDTENNFNIPNHVKQAVITNFKQKANLSKPKGRGKFSRTSSMTQIINTLNSVSGIATLPRRKNHHNVKCDGNLEKSKKINWFFLGKGKS